MRDPKKNCLSNVTYWMRCCLEYGMTVEDVIADFTARGQGASGRVKARQGVKASRRKENEGEKENTSPTPPLRVKGEEKESSSSSPRGRAREEENGNPTFPQVDKYAAANGVSASFAQAWFDRMNRANEFKRWRHPKSGKPIKHWQSYFLISWRRRDEFDPCEPTPAAPKPRVYTPADWALCAERCRHFDTATCSCRRDLTVPPALAPTPHPPEECHKFTPNH